MIITVDDSLSNYYGSTDKRSKYKLDQFIDQLTYLKSAFIKLSIDWQHILFNLSADDLLDIDTNLFNLSLDKIIYPPQEFIFEALNYIPDPKQIKVIILGQDPYHGEGQANGLAFAVKSGIKIPPSLKNIFKEVLHEYQSTTGVKVIHRDNKSFTLKNIYNNQINIIDGTLLDKWASQGVLLLNSSLSVIQGKANSLAKIGWQQVTDKLIGYLAQSLSKLVFMLWGDFATKKKSVIQNQKTSNYQTSQHLVLTSSHPSPLSAYRGFFGCDHFILANQYLLKNRGETINWL